MSKTRDDYVTRMHAEIDQLNSNMDALQARTNEVKADALEKYTHEMEKLRQQSNLAMTKLAEMRSASQNSWDAMVADMNKIHDAFVNSFIYFNTQLKK